MTMLNLIAQIATVVSVLVAAGTVWASVRMAWRQMNVMAFTTYASRFEAIMSDFPGHAYTLRFCIADQLPPASDDLSLCVLRYLNLCSEEFYLHRSGYLDRQVWRIWEREIKRTLASPLVVREWPSLLSEFEEYQEFIAFVQRAQEERGPSAAPLGHTQAPPVAAAGAGGLIRENPHAAE